MTDLDAIDGSPVYDLAPYFKEMGPRGEVREPGWPGEMLKDYWDDPRNRKRLCERRQGDARRPGATRVTPGLTVRLPVGEPG